LQLSGSTRSLNGVKVYFAIKHSGKVKLTIRLQEWNENYEIQPKIV
jgi:hypothetical protein